MFELYTKVIKNTRYRADYQAIEELRKKLKHDKRTINVQDFGAGTKKNGARQNSIKNEALTYQRSVKDIAQKAEKAPKFGQLFYRLIQHFEYKTIFDLGTSLGITTAYEALAAQSAKIISFEGCPETAKIAQENFSTLALQNIELVIGNLDDVLAKKVAEVEKIDFVFFDANHRYEPTIRYFEVCVEKAHEESLFVFDDIYWSKEMTAAWEHIKNHPSVSLTIDLFFVGLVFFRKKQPKQHFVLRY